MNRRLVVTAVIAGVLTGGLVAPALASSPDSGRHKVCVFDYGSEGWCVVWDDPTASSAQ